jgi:hypothetical protein
MIQTKDIKKKKLIKLVDWIVEGVMAIFPKDRPVTTNRNHTGSDFRL